MCPEVKNKTESIEKNIEEIKEEISKYKNKNEKLINALERRGKSSNEVLRTLIITSTWAIRLISIIICLSSIVCVFKKCVTDATPIISAGVGIIGIMMALWTVLTITNAVSRRDVEKMKDNIESAEESMSQINTYIKDNVSIQKEMFFVEASKNNWDPLLRYIVSTIKEEDDENKDEYDNGNDGDDANLYSDLTIIELLYTQVKNLHQREYNYDKQLIDVAEKGIKRIEEIKKRAITKVGILEFLNYRFCGFNFFAGYCDSSYEKSANRFFISAEGYDTMRHFFAVSELHIEKNDSSIIKRKCHLDNSIGESYSKIVQYYNESEDLRLKLNGKISLVTDRAIDMCSKAVKAGENNLDKHTLYVFSRNLGNAYERVQDMKDAQHEDTELVVSEREKIVDTYEKALLYAKDDDSIKVNDLKSAYERYLAVLGKHIINNKIQEYTPSKDINEKGWKNLNKYTEEAKYSFPWAIEFKLIDELINLLKYKITTCQSQKDTLKQQIKDMKQDRETMSINKKYDKRINFILKYLDETDYDELS